MRVYNETKNTFGNKFIDLSGDRISFYNLSGKSCNEECLATIVQQSDNTIWVNGSISDIGKFLIEFIKGV